MAGSETFGVESGFAEEVLEWMNNEAKKRKSKFEARAYNYEITTKNFGTFEMFSWIGDVKAARNLIIKASKRFKVRVIEGGYRTCLLYTSPSPRDRQKSRMPSSA